MCVGGDGREKEGWGGSSGTVKRAAKWVEEKCAVGRREGGTARPLRVEENLGLGII